MLPMHLRTSDRTPDTWKPWPWRLKNLLLGIILATAQSGPSGIATIAVPGLGFLIIGGPLAAALGDTLVGGAIGAIAGGLLGLRVPDHRAKAYEESLRKGSTIISIHADNAEELRQAREILTAAQADEILEVNGRSLEDATHTEVISHIHQVNSPRVLFACHHAC